MASPMTATRRILSSLVVAALVAAPITLLPTVASAEDAPAEVVTTEPASVADEPAAPVEPAPVVETPAAAPTAAPAPVAPNSGTTPAKPTKSVARAIPARPGAVTNLELTRPSPTVLRATWTSASGDYVGYDVSSRAIGDTGARQSWNRSGFGGIGPGTTQIEWEVDATQRYDVEVMAYGPQSEGPAVLVAEPLAAPGVPTNLAATPMNGQLGLSWTAPSDAFGTVTYEVRYKLVSASTWTGPVTSTTTSTVIGSLTPGATYDLQVLAKNPAGSSAWSATVNAMTAAPTAPGAITGASAARSTSTLSLLRFTAPANWGSGTPNNIEFQRAVFGTDTWVAVGTTGTTTTALNTPADSAMRYTYRFRANSVGASGPWVTADETFPTPSAPTSFTLTPGLNTVTATWNAPTGAVGKLTYVVSYNYYNASYDQVTTDATSYTFDNLTPGKNFYIFVKAMNPGATGGNTVAVQTAAAGLPSPVTNIFALSNNAGATVTWTTPPLAGGTLIGWDVRYRSSEGWTELRAPSTAANYTASALTNDVEYEFQVRAITSAGTADWSTSALVTPAVPRVSTAPRELTSTPSATGLTLNWVAPADFGTRPFSFYRVEYATAGGTVWTQGSTSGSSAGPSSYTGARDWRVAAVTSAGTGAYTYIYNVTAYGKVLGAPTDLTVVPGNRSLSAAWTAPATDSQTLLTGYTVSFRLSGGSWSSVSTSATSFTLNSLQGGADYELQVRANGPAGASPDSPIVATTTLGPPSAITNLTASAGLRSATLNWNAPAANGADILRYNVRETSGTLVATVTETTVTITGLTQGTSKTYYVEAVNVYGTGSVNSTVTVVPYGPPTQGSIIGATRGDARVTINAQFSAQTGLPVTQEFQMRTGGGEWVDVATPAGFNFTAYMTYTFLGLENGTTYEFRMRNVNSVGASDWSAPVSATPVVPVPASAPRDFTSTHTGATATFTWTEPESSGTEPITSYSIEYRAAGSTGVWTTTSVSAAARSYSAVWSGLRDYRIAARTSVGLGAHSALIESINSYGFPPNAPTGLTVIPNETGFLAAWTASEPKPRTPSVTSYRLEHRVKGTTTWTLRTTADVSWAQAGLTPGATYEVRVTAVSTAGQSPATGVVETTVGVPTVITSVTATRGDRSAAVSWNAPNLGIGTGATLVGYDLQYRAGSTGEWVTAPRQTTTSLTVTGLTNGTSYGFRARAVNNRGAANWSAIATVTPAGVPDAPVVTSTRGDGKASFTWDAPSPNGADITGYQMRFRTAELPNWMTNSSVGTSRVSNFSGFTNGVPIEVQVRAVNIVGQGDWSQSAFATPAALPGIPVVTATRGDHEATLSWSNVASNGATISSNDVRYRTGDGEWTAATKTTITDLINGTRYEFQVRAVNEVGPGGWSESVFATPAGLPGIPADLTVERGDESASASWEPVDANGGTDLEYELEYRAGDGEWASIPASMTDLTNGTRYEVRVRATNDVGAGAWSASVFVTPAGAPGEVDGFDWTPIADGVSLSWDAADDNGAEITGYDVELSDGETTDVTTSATTSVDITGLGNNTNWTVRIRAVNDVSAGAWLEAGDVTAGTTASAPVVTVTPGDARIGVSWVAPTFTGGSAIIGYEVSWKPRGSDARASTVVVAGLSTTLTGLANSTEYEITVRALNQTAIGDSSDASFAYAYGFTASFTTDDGSPVASLNPGDKVIVNGSGTLPGATVFVELHSTPIALGSTQVAENGTFRLVVTIPRNAPLGKHSLYAGLGMGGGLIAETDVAITVAAVAGADSGDSLAITGLDENSLYLALWFALGAAVLGTTLLVTRRRRTSK